MTVPPVSYTHLDVYKRQPQTSIVGMLLEHAEDYTVVHSKQIGIAQHDPYSWEILGPDFVCLESVTAGCRFMDETVKVWVDDMSPEAVSYTHLMALSFSELLGKRHPRLPA